MLPRILRNFNVIIEARPMAGVAEEITLPKLDRKMEEFRGAGMLAPVSVDLGLEALKLEFTLGEYNADVLRSWGLAAADAIGVRFLGAARADDTSGVDAIEIAVRGRWKTLDAGTVKLGDPAKLKVEMPLVYFRYNLNGTAIIEIDVIAGREVVAGTDRSADVARALGITA